ncbi:IS5 family transposase [Oscillospiraceae bacterium 50-58]
MFHAVYFTTFCIFFLDCFSEVINTKLHAIVDGLGNPVEFMLSAGNDHDSVHAVELLEKVEISGSNVLADRAYGAKAIRAYISEQGADYVIPPQSNISEPWPVDWWLYKERHLVECFFQKLKWFRRIATRYDKLDASFLAFVYLASIAILLI